MTEIGTIMIQQGDPIKQWVCPHCGYILYTSLYETQSPQCPACAGESQKWVLNEKDSLVIDKKM